MSVKEYKCPCCDGGMEFDSAAQKLKCPYCANEMDLAAYKEYEEAAGLGGTDGDTYDWGEEEHRCPSCGNVLDEETTKVAAKCPYCGGNLIFADRVDGKDRPELIIPFQIDQKAAEETYRKFWEGRRLLPKSFKREQKIEKISGIYVPFWLFSCKAEGTVHFDGIKIEKWKDQNYEYTKKEFFLVTGDGSVNFDRVPVDASVKMDDAYMESIEPYDTGKAVPFEEAYLSGYEAEKYDVSKEETRPRAEQRIKTGFENALKKSVSKTPYDIMTYKNAQIHCTNGKVQYALLPVWTLDVKYRDQTYQFAVNGQTGKITGELPVDSGRYLKNALGIFAVSGGIIYLLLLLLFL